jgi:hypothetical protein
VARAARAVRWVDRFELRGADTALPVCESSQVTSSGLNESDPVPLHVPLTLIAVSPGAVGVEGLD